MASAQDLRKRIKVFQYAKITKAMKMVASARLRRAQTKGSYPSLRRKIWAKSCVICLIVI